MAGKLDGLGDPAELITGLLSSAPSDLFTFKKVQEDGTIKDFAIRIKLMRLEEDTMILRDSQGYAKANGELPESYGDIYRNAQAAELLTRAICHTEEKVRADGTRYYPPLFSDSRQLRASFTAPEMAQCLNMYELVKAKYGAIETFTDEEYGRWRDRLSDQLRSGFFLQLLDSAHWPILMCRLAEEATHLRTLLELPSSTSLDTSASGLPSSESGTGEFSTLPDGRSDDGIDLPTDHIMGADEARERVQRITKPKK